MRASLRRGATALNQKKTSTESAEAAEGRVVISPELLDEGMGTLAALGDSGAQRWLSR